MQHNLIIDLRRGLVGKSRLHYCPVVVVVKHRSPSSDLNSSEGLEFESELNDVVRYLIHSKTLCLADGCSEEIPAIEPEQIALFAKR